MKRLAAAILVWMFIIPCVACAEDISLDFATATDEELSEAIDQIREEQAARYREKAANREIEADTDGITFRGIPWNSTMNIVEAELGECDYLYERALGEMSDYWGGVGFSSYGELGCTGEYYELSVAGYEAYAYVYYIYPVTDGQILRETDLAEMYMAQYSLSGFGDIDSVYEDLLEKLTQLYGDGAESDDAADMSTVWTDDEGNSIYLQYTSFSTGDYISIVYVAADAEERISEIKEAYNDELIAEEDALRSENVDNTDGL